MPSKCGRLVNSKGYFGINICPTQYLGPDYNKMHTYSLDIGNSASPRCYTANLSECQGTM